MLNTTDILLDCDGYKLGHRKMLRTKTTRILSNFTARSSRIEDQTWTFSIGQQLYIKKYLEDAFEEFFSTSREQLTEILNDFTAEINDYLGPDQQIGEDHILKLWNLGYIPLQISALPEGTKVPLRVPNTLVENTHDDFAWLVNYFESLMSSVLWPIQTSATTAYRFRKILEDYAGYTGSPKEFVGWQGHDFSFRGMMGPEAAALSGVGHLLMFEGTDTIPAIREIRRYYGAPKGHMIGGSVSATEHMIQCLGTKEGEFDTYKRLLDTNPTGVLSIVSDTWDLWNVLTNFMPQLRDQIMSRNGKLVIRPDSGDPEKIICGDPSYPVDSPAHKGVVRLLWDVFGGTTTSTGYKLLDSHVGAIYGDSITESRLESILYRLHTNGFASANMVFGVGSFTYQYVTRDTYGFAMKATWAMVDGQGVDMFKDPITDDGTKKSAKGRLAVVMGKHNLVLINQATPEQEAISLLRPIWRNGKFLVTETFDVIRARARVPVEYDR